MFLRYVFMSLSALVMLSVMSGCTVIREYTPEAEKVTVAQAEYDLARQLLQAFVKNDAETFVNLLPESVRSKFTVENFADTRKAVLESVGEPVSYSYVTTLELATLHPQVWKVRFRRSNVNNTKEFHSEVLFKVITGMISDKEAVITGFHFL